ncbi:autotransporter domain-containing protein [Taklimakanibacter lacteus]|uniref:autotransporter domain-containing protein n=1 Tax=Taklimakanibacter lacteus TaxID=2268456 RepID=UPI0013C460CE
MKPSCLFRRRLALTTILTIMPFATYGRQAYAGCDPVVPGSSTYLCTGSAAENTTRQEIGVPNADVSTAPGFGVDATDLSGIFITGAGHLRFTDENSSFIKGNVNGVSVTSTGNMAAPNLGAVTIKTNGEIEGVFYGILARNYGEGHIEITTYGKVTGTNESGIFALDNGGGDLKITTGAGSMVEGGEEGIRARNLGGGLLEITAKGDVTGLTGAGIAAYAGLSGNGVTVKTEARVTGADDGILANNQGGGDTIVTANGEVTGGDDDAGIAAVNLHLGKNMEITTGADSAVKGGDGIFAQNYGNRDALGNDGDLTIAVKGEVEGTTDAGIHAYNSHYGDTLKIVAEATSVITGIDHGIYARNSGAGALDISVQGAVSTVSGIGIEVQNRGGDATLIKVGAGGIVEGGYSAIFAESDDEQAVSITNEGVLRNLSGAADALAIEVNGGAATIENKGALIGTLLLDAFDDSVTNRGGWITAGADFAGGNDTLVNYGTLIVAGNGGEIEPSSFDDLEFFINFGTVTLVDGQAGDKLTAETSYFSNGGRLAVDAVLGPEGRADYLILDSVGGVTRVSVNLLDATGANLEGIPIAYTDGNTQPGDFLLADGPLNAGFFTWDIRYNALAGSHDLFTSGIGTGAYEMAGGITGTQDIWQQTIGTVLHRQADLRSLLAGTQVTPVADFGEPVEPAASGRVLPGFWFKGVGGYLERDAEQDGFDLDREQTVFGGLAGFDFAMDAGPGDAMLFGIFGGYLTSTLKFSTTGTKWTYDGPTLGAYATYLNEAFYVDATVKADFLAIDIDPDALAPAADKADTDGFNLGARLDTGYKIGLEHGLFVEPQASLAVLYSEIDNVEIYGGEVDFDDETSVRGRLGLRLGHELTAADQLVYSSDVTASIWQEFNGGNEAVIAVADFPSFDVSDDPVETFGDVSIGFGVTAPEGWSGFVRGNWQFAEGFDALSANAGLRYAW